jgi:hypothetical protein
MYSPSAVSWQQADDGVHVATVDGEYAGFTDATGTGVRAHSARGRDLGRHLTDDLARAAVVASVLSAPPRVVADTTRPRRKTRRGAPVAPATRKRGKTRWPLAP